MASPWRQRAVILGLIAFAGLLVAMRVSGADMPGEPVPVVSRNHIPSVTSPHEPYNSDPPTSGPHVGADVPIPGWYTQTLPYERLVHALEHGTVVIYYGPDVPAADMAVVRRLYDRFPDKVLVVPSHDGAPGLVMTSWGRMLRLEHAAYGEMERYVRAWGGRDWHVPE